MRVPIVSRITYSFFENRRRYSVYQQGDVHLKGSAHADLAATATPIEDPSRRREILAAIDHKVGRGWDVDAWVEGSPLVEVELAG
ncbi:MAG: hypothetical protein O6837_09210 [Deltaproteobacteria bacterium]|nr:hypothetical protein [Deltaproteobacteria bacterium]